MNITSTQSQPQQHRANPAFKAYEIDLKRIQPNLRKAVTETIKENVGKADRLILPELKIHNAFVGFHPSVDDNKIIIAIDAATEELKLLVLTKLNAILKAVGIKDLREVIVDTGADKISRLSSRVEIETNGMKSLYTKPSGYYFKD